MFRYQLEEANPMSQTEGSTTGPLVMADVNAALLLIDCRALAE
jgi:hypothetical protein